MTPKQKYPSEYRSWSALRTRCRNKNSQDWKQYGGRGITCCDRWDSFLNFLKDMGPKPAPKYSIDRIDNSKGYFPENCRWASPTEQALNKNNSHGLCKLTTVSCDFCGKVVTRQFNFKDNRHGFCDQKCHHNFYSKKVQTKCECGKKILVRNTRFYGHGKHSCSNKCRLKKLHKARKL